MMTTRLHCCVPFCRRTTAHTEFSEWLCGDHWRLVDRRRRQVYGRYMRQWRRYRGAPSGLSRSEHNAAHRIWERLKRQAIERAAGIA